MGSLHLRNKSTCSRSLIKARTPLEAWLTRFPGVRHEFFSRVARPGPCCSVCGQQRIAKMHAEKKHSPGRPVLADVFEQHEKRNGVRLNPSSLDRLDFHAPYFHG